MIGPRPAIGSAAAAVFIVLIIAASAVTVEEIQTSKAGGTTTTVTVFEPPAASVTRQGSMQSGSSQVALTTVYLLPASFVTDSGSTTFACATGPGSSAFLALTNIGTQAEAVTGVTIIWAGSSSHYLPSGSCSIGPAGAENSTTYVVFPDSSAISASPVAGQPFSGSIELSNGAQVPLGGNWGEPAGASPSAQVSVTSVNAPEADFAKNGGGSAFVCSTSAGNNPYVAVNNTGTAAASVTGMTITWAGASDAFSPAGSCSVGADGSATAITYINLPNPAAMTSPAVAGQTFSGTITLSNGATILFTGSFEQSVGVYETAQVSVTGTALPAADFTSAGSSDTFVCATSSASSPFIVLSNTGSGSAMVTSATITWAGASNSFTAAATCSVGAGGSATSTTYLLFSIPSMLSLNAVTGQTFSGTVTLSNGTQLLFSGTWQ